MPPTHWLALATTLLLAVPAAATPTCDLVVDATHDLLHYAAPAPVYRPEVDIVSGDLATNATTLTVVGRVASLPAPSAGTGTALLFEIEVGGRDFQASVLSGWDGGLAELRAVVPLGPAAQDVVTLATAAPVRDAARGELRASFPLVAFDGYAGVPTGTEIALTYVSSYLHAGSATPPRTARASNGFPLHYDNADDVRATYHAGDESCVTVGG